MNRRKMLIKAVLHKLLRILKKIGSVAVEVCAGAYKEIILLITSVSFILLHHYFVPFESSDPFLTSLYERFNGAVELVYYSSYVFAVCSFVIILCSIWITVPIKNEE